MNFNDYQQLAARTINTDLSQYEMIMHALHGIVGEIGEIHSLYQKEYQGHAFEQSHLWKEVGDLLWFVAELCTAYGVNMADVARANINKLKARYPEGFTAENSLHRQEGDI